MSQLESSHASARIKNKGLISFFETKLRPTKSTRTSWIKRLNMNWKFGDNINTDLITPGRYNISTDPKELAKACFVEYRPEFRQKVQPGDFVVAGENFGCGSSRETAPVALKASNIRAVVAKSYARIFFRNAINLGLLCVIANTDLIDEHDELLLDINSHQLKNTTKGQVIPAQIPSMMLRLYEEGGIISYLKKHGLNALSDLEKF
jgi:3-isopropylmalate/(R)-2-methylmalate dehydratase small subunit